MNAAGFHIARAKFLALTLALAAGCGSYHTVPENEAGADADAAAPTDAAKPVESGAVESGTSCGTRGTLCGGSCVNTNTNQKYCGSCSTSCTANGFCGAGECCYPATEGGYSGGACIVYPPCGCPQGEMCTRPSTASEQCVPNGTTPANEACQTSSQCEPGLACTGGYCQPMCSTSATCATNWACLAQISGTTGGYSVCDPHCNPVDTFATDSSHEACLTGQRCDPLFNTLGQTTCDSPAGIGLQGATCTTNADCAANYLCTAPTGQTDTCRQFCRIGFSDCLGGLTCYTFVKPQYDGTQQIGVCQ